MIHSMVHFCYDMACHLQDFHNFKLVELDMKKYHSIGSLFADYRAFNELSQNEFAHMLDVDLRTIQRWEKDLTLIKSEKEEDIVLNTLMPYQLIHNLNAAVPIPTYYDLRLRKYSTSDMTNGLPHANWFRDQIEVRSDRLRPIDVDFDMKYLKRFIESQQRDEHFLNEELIKESVRLLPELNLVLTTSSGYYSSHCVILPLKEEAYQKLRNKELTKKELRASDLMDPKHMDKQYFFNYDSTADSNDNAYYLLAAFLRFFRELSDSDYLFATISEREDGYLLNQQVGLEVIWEDLERQQALGWDFPPRFIEGNYKKFLTRLD